MKTNIERSLPDNSYQAAVNANTPSAANPFATQTITDNLQTQINAISPGNVLISGGVVWSGVGFIYDVSALEYKIQGVTYNSLATSVTLSAADPSDPRVDVIYADDSGNVGVLTGVPSPSPTKPTVDSATQIEVTFVTVPAGSTTPVISTVLIYNENIGAPGEWNTSSDDVNVNFNSTLDPYAGLKSVNTQLPLGINREIIFTKGTPYPVNGGMLSFRIKAKNAMNTAGGRLYVGFFNGGTLQGNSVYIGGSNATIYGFNPNNTTSYQLVSIPMSAFGVLPATVAALRFYRLTGTSTANFFLDYIQIQEGVVTVPSAAPGHVIYDETTQLAQRTKLTFVGTGVTATDDAVNDQTVVTIPTAQAYSTVEDEGVALTQRNIINFVGGGVSAADAGGKTVVTIPTQQAYATVEDEGVALTQRNVINFTGAGVTATDAGGKTVVDIPVQPAYATIEDEGVALTQRSTMNFVGAGVTVTDAGGKTVITIPTNAGYSTVEDEGVALTQRSTINFVGAGVTVTDAGGKTVVTISGGGGGGGWTVTTQAGASYTAANGDYVLINAATHTVTLPAASANARVGVKMINATVTNIQVKTASAGVTIDGVDRSVTGYPVYNQWDAVTFLSDGTNWFIEA